MAQSHAPPRGADIAGAADRRIRAKSLAAVADARVSNAWLRLGGCGLVACVTVSLVGGILPLVWLGGLVVVLMVERLVHKKLRARCAGGEPPANMIGLIIWTAFQSSYGNLIAIQLWMAKYVHGETLAVIYLLAGLVNAAATLRSSGRLALAGAVPTVLFLIGLPIADYVLNGGRYIADLTPLIAVFMFIGFGANMWTSLRAADVATAQAEAATLRERQAAAAAAAAKSDTIRRISDELRTPMQALIGAAEHLRRVAASPEARTHIAALAQAGDVLRMVLEDVSDLDRIENDQLAINPQPCDPRDLVRGVASAFRAAATDKGLELFLDVAPDVPAQVEIDAVRVRQILFNLVSNAVKFTQHGGVRIRLQAQAADSSERVRLGFLVADTGVGMSRSHLAVLFSRERVGVGEGPGLGLAISLRLARLMGGRIGAKSELGGGSSFSLVLEAPMLAPAVPALAPPRRDRSVA